MPIRLLLSALALFSSATAADKAIADPVCYFHPAAPGVVSKCIGKDILLQHAPVWCTESWDTKDGQWSDYRDPMGSGTASMGKSYIFASQKDCLAVFRRIVEFCHGGGWSGGVWTDNGVSLNINMCDWP